MTYVSTIEALVDGTRRALLERLRSRPHAVGELATALRVTQPAVSQHLRVLEHARLVDFHRSGRRKVYTRSRDGLAESRAYLEAFWNDVRVAFAADDPGPPSPARRRSSGARAARRPRRQSRRAP